MNQKPTGITGDRGKRTLTITWTNDHVSVYSFSLLRNGCPCASCQGGHENMKATPDESVFAMPDSDSPATRLRDLEPVGTYGLSLIWEDGHHDGIYTWDYLRALCPCPQCRPRSESDA